MSRWLRWARRTDDARATLFCFHHAGSGASCFQPWVRVTPPSLNLAFVQLPGRENHIRVPPHRRMQPIVNALLAEMRDALTAPYAFFGHSLGARVSFSLAHRLTAEGLPAPQVLLLSGTPGPAVHGWKHVHHLPDEELVRQMEELGGVSDVVLRTPGLLSRFLPCIRADLEVAETCSLAYDTSLDCPVHAFAGADDRLVTPDMVRAWSTVTTGTFDFHLFPGGHFFIQTSQRQVVDRVLTALGPLLSPTALVGPAATQEVHIPTAEFPRRKSG